MVPKVRRRQLVRVGLGVVLAAAIVGIVAALQPGDVRLRESGMPPADSVVSQSAEDSIQGLRGTASDAAPASRRGVSQTKDDRTAPTSAGPPSAHAQPSRADAAADEAPSEPAKLDLSRFRRIPIGDPLNSRGATRLSPLVASGPPDKSSRGGLATVGVLLLHTDDTPIVGATLHVSDDHGSQYITTGEDGHAVARDLHAGSRLQINVGSLPTSASIFRYTENGGIEESIPTLRLGAEEWSDGDVIEFRTERTATVRVLLTGTYRQYAVRSLGEMRPALHMVAAAVMLPNGAERTIGNTVSYRAFAGGVQLEGVTPGRIAISVCLGGGGTCRAEVETLPGQTTVTRARVYSGPCSLRVAIEAAGAEPLGPLQVLRLCTRSEPAGHWAPTLPEPDGSGVRTVAMDGLVVGEYLLAVAGNAGNGNQGIGRVVSLVPGENHVALQLTSPIAGDATIRWVKPRTAELSFISHGLWQLDSTRHQAGAAGTYFHIGPGGGSLAAGRYVATFVHNLGGRTASGSTFEERVIDLAPGENTYYGPR
jgi:hypothetical protein